MSLGHENKQPSIFDKHVGRRLRARRKELGLSQEKLGELLGLTFQQVQKYEKGVNRISAGRLYEVALVLGEDVAYFFAGLPSTVSGEIDPMPVSLSPQQVERLRQAKASLMTALEPVFSMDCDATLPVSLASVSVMGDAA